jgi:hypothetical protein
MPHAVGLLMSTVAVAALSVGAAPGSSTGSAVPTSSHCATSAHHRHCQRANRDLAPAEIQTEAEAVAIATAVLVTALAAL